MKVDIKQQCEGRWSGVLANLGVPEQFFNGKHQDCPICGDDHKNSRWNKAKEYLVCSKCGVIQPVEIAMFFTGESFKKTASIIRNERPERMEPVKQSDDTAKNLERIDGIKKGLRPLNGECIASLYLAKRGLTVLPEKDVYFHPGVKYWSDGMESKHPAMVSIFRNLEGKGATFHITYLSADGKKADVESPKKILPVVFPLPGCSIQMFAPVDGVLAVAEGIETAMAVIASEGLPVWAAGNAGNLAAMELPGDLKELWIYADVDPGFSGQQAAYSLARSASNSKKYPSLKKIRVVMQQFSGDVNIITDDGNKLDFLDALLLQGQCSASQVSAT